MLECITVVVISKTEHTYKNAKKKKKTKKKQQQQQQQHVKNISHRLHRIRLNRPWWTLESWVGIWYDHNSWLNYKPNFSYVLIAFKTPTCCTKDTTPKLINILRRCVHVCGVLPKTNYILQNITLPFFKRHWDGTKTRAVFFCVSILCGRTKVWWPPGVNLAQRLPELRGWLRDSVKDGRCK